MNATRQKEIVRGKILYYLALVYPQAVTLPLLQGELDLFGYPVPMDELIGHLAYLGEKGMVKSEETIVPASRNPRLPGARMVHLIKITAKGIDYHDGRLPADAGVCLEAKR